MSDFTIRRRLRSFGYAFQGAKALLVTQHNAWIHAVATVAVIIAGSVRRVSRAEWALLVWAIALGWLAEAMNTAIEFLATKSPRPYSAAGPASGGLRSRQLAESAASLLPSAVSAPSGLAAPALLPLEK